MDLIGLVVIGVVIVCVGGFLIGSLSEGGAGFLFVFVPTVAIIVVVVAVVGILLKGTQWLLINII